MSRISRTWYKATVMVHQTGDIVLSLQGIGKRYRIREEKRYLAKEVLQRVLRRRRSVDFWALRNIDLDVRRGESLGIIGENGSGKSTLLKILSNVTVPTEGAMTVNGRVSALLELGAGFHPDLSGRENIYLNGTIMGMRKRRIDQKIEEIIDFSGIRKFIDTPVKFYSSGMYVRLGFAIAMHLDPDILVIDEVLAVGDEEFQRRSKTAIHEFREQGKTLVVVSHDLSIIRDVCDRVAWLKEGCIHHQGSIETITSEYLLHISERFGVVTLSRGPLTLIFERGKLILFWKGIELTKNICGFTYLVSSGTWQSSNQNRWTVNERSDVAFRAVADWKLMPVRQTWQVSIGKDNSFRWRIEMEILRDIPIQNDAVNLLLTDRYSQWVSGGESGDFPEQFFDGFGQRLIAVGEDPDEIGVRGRRLGPLVLPEIRFRRIPQPDRAPDAFLSQVTNTDRFQKSRCLQFSRMREETVYCAGELLVFEGVVSLNADSGPARDGEPVA